MTSTLTSAPARIRSGDSARWRIELADYPASAGWALEYTAISPLTKFSIASTADGDAHAVALSPADTTAFAPGYYTLIGQVSDGTDVYTVFSGRLDVAPNLTTADGHDGRSHARKMLAAIEAALEDRASSDQLDLIELSIYSRSTKRGTGALIEAREKYQAEVRREDAAAGRRPAGGRVYMRF